MRSGQRAAEVGARSRTFDNRAGLKVGGEVPRGPQGRSK
jgi:hypothetical protein